MLAIPFNKINLTPYIIIFLSLFILIAMVSKNPPLEKKAVIDSNMTFEEAVKDSRAPKRIIKMLTIVSVQYYDFEETLREGQLVVNKNIARHVKALFKEIKKHRFPIKSAIPIVRFQWNDSLSMAHNNTSAFNYRFIEGKLVLSDHSYGIALDINPYQNPYISKSQTLPKNAVYNPKAKGTITRSGAIYKFLMRRGWSWGGNWRYIKDYHHFERK